MAETIKERLIWLNSQYFDGIGAYQVACEDALEEIERLERELQGHLDRIIRLVESKETLLNHLLQHEKAWEELGRWIESDSAITTRMAMEKITRLRPRAEE